MLQQLTAAAHAVVASARSLAWLR